MVKKKWVRCMNCEMLVNLDEVRFDSVEAAEGCDFICKVCIFSVRLDRVEGENVTLASCGSPGKTSEAGDN